MAHHLKSTFAEMNHIRGLILHYESKKVMLNRIDQFYFDDQY